MGSFSVVSNVRRFVLAWLFLGTAEANVRIVDHDGQVVVLVIIVVVVVVVVAVLVSASVDAVLARRGEEEEEGATT
eukprot:scaffold18202_cov211-Amphora_coffeaeformis.AAC.1